MSNTSAAVLLCFRFPQQLPPFSTTTPRIASLAFLHAASLSRHFNTSRPYSDPSASSSATRPPPRLPWPERANPTPYEIFNLPRTATQTEIKSRYFQLVKQYHPDHAPRAPVDCFRKVVEAYKILSQPSKRHEYDSQHPSPEQTRHRQAWSGSRLSRLKTQQKGPPPSGRWSYSHANRHRPYVNPDYLDRNVDANNSHFNYERHFRRNLEQEMKIKKRLDELHAHRMEFEKQEQQNRQSARLGLAFAGSLFMLLVFIAKALAPA
jgi:hypothetical protein